ncbi:DUF2142 domain-containing protein [Aurantibacillus circumpalustris]|uniref:DUF2142 domain-containing protein n=1 Tax=Aurantibacillus circumpalustris TaxID=3036359 RepID=UPI00295BE179|nr:DUF2142 domain-containing protein [Aurantibacillus circumpalustris]
MEFKKDHWKILVICLLGALRVFVFSAGFPFFNNVDEVAHLDVVVKYSHGETPHSFELMSKESARYYVRNGSCEFSMLVGDWYKPLNYDTLKDPKRIIFDENESKFSKVINYESLQPPLYYTLAGGWKKLGTAFGFKNLSLLYWIRFLNIVFIILLVLLAYKASATLFPGDRFLVFGVPLIVAMLPQDTYYSIQNDVLSPLCFALTFVLLLKFVQTDLAQSRLAIFTGLAIALTVLVKVSNLPLLGIVILAVVYKMYKLKSNKKSRHVFLPLALFGAFTFIPIICWLMWNFYVLGDITGSEGKINFFGWTHKPFLEWFNHPIFSNFSGVFFMWKELMITFWRGEFVWGSQRVAEPLMDFFYWVSSLIFVLVTLIFVQRKLNPFQRNVNRFVFLCFVSMIAYMVLLSISFDFGDSFYPSKASPYFTSGRLISAVLLPFALLYAQGFNWLFSWIKNERLRFLLLIGVVFVITLSEISASQKVFLSNFNWFRF